MKATPTSRAFEVGILSDTHGPVPRPALAALEGVDHILHAGDVVGESVIKDLEAIAPTTAVRGNMDRGNSTGVGSKTQYVSLAGVGIYMLHDLYQLDIDPAAAGVSMVVHGHTHQARIEWIGGVLYINPGSASQPRGGRPASIAVVSMAEGTLTPEIIRLRR